MNQKGSTTLVLLVGLVIILGGALGYMVLMQQAAKSDAIILPQDDSDIFKAPPIQKNTRPQEERTVSQTESAVCADFDMFKSTVFSALATGPTSNLKPTEKSATDTFSWRKSEAEPFVNYPFVRFAKIAGPEWAAPLDNDSIQEEMHAAIPILESSSKGAAATIGLTADAPNTLPLENSNWCGMGGCTDTWNRGYIRWSFIRGQSLYIVSLAATANSDAPGAVVVVAACAAKDVI